MTRSSTNGDRQNFAKFELKFTQTHFLNMVHHGNISNIYNPCGDSFEDANDFLDPHNMFLCSLSKIS